VNRYVEAEHDNNSEQKAWHQFLRHYGYLYTDELDSLLVGYVERGYFDSQALGAQLNDKNQESRRTGGRRHHRVAWNLFLESFEPNVEKFVNALVDGFRDKMEYLSLNELDETVVVLRQLESVLLPSEHDGPSAVLCTAGRFSCPKK
jgi:hypothetical protein